MLPTKENQGSKRPRHEKTRKRLQETHLKVPRSTSCPDTLTWMPSLRRDPKAIASASAQSVVRSFTMSMRALKILFRPVRSTKYIMRYKNARERERACHRSMHFFSHHKPTRVNTDIVGEVAPHCRSVCTTNILICSRSPGQDTHGPQPSYRQILENSIFISSDD